MRLGRGEIMEWIAPGPDFVRYTIRNGGTAAVVERDPAYGPLYGADRTALRLPLSPVAWRYIAEIPDRTEMDAQGNQRAGYSFVIEYLLHGAARTGTPLAVLTRSGDRHFEPSFVSRIDPRPLAARHCTPSRIDPALSRRIVVVPGR